MYPSPPALPKKNHLNIPELYRFNKQIPYLKKLSIAILSIVAASPAFALEDYKQIHTDYTVSGSGGFESVSNGSFEYNNIEAIIGIAKDIWQGQGPEAWTGKTTTAFNVSNSNLTAYGDISIVNNANYPNIGNNNALYAQNNSIVNINAENVIIASLPSDNKLDYFSPKEDSAITVRDNSSVSITGNVVQIIGNIDIRGNTSTVKLNLSGNSSYWFGNSTSSQLSLQLSDGATWIYDRESFWYTTSINSSIKNLTLDNGIIALNEEYIKGRIEAVSIFDGTEEPATIPDFYISNGEEFNQHPNVDIENLSGTGGYFLVDLDWKSNSGQKRDTAQSDFIQIGTVLSENSHQIVLFDNTKAHLDEMNVGDKLYFASVESGATTFTRNADGEVNNADELYAFDYFTACDTDQQDDLTYWYLTKAIGHTNENVAFLETAPLVSYVLATQIDRLHDRMNEARRDDNGFWVRYNFSKSSFDGAFDTDAHMIQVGYDHDVSSNDSRKFVGFSFDYTSADTDLDALKGSGDNQRYALSLYYTVLADCGGYADIVGKVGRIGSDYDLRNSTGADISSRFWQTYYGVSAELGWKYQATASFFVDRRHNSSLRALKATTSPLKVEFVQKLMTRTA